MFVVHNSGRARRHKRGTEKKRKESETEGQGKAKGVAVCDGARRQCDDWDPCNGQDSQVAPTSATTRAWMMVVLVRFKMRWG